MQFHSRVILKTLVACGRGSKAITLLSVISLAPVSTNIITVFNGSLRAILCSAPARVPKRTNTESNLGLDKINLDFLNLNNSNEKELDFLIPNKLPYFWSEYVNVC